MVTQTVICEQECLVACPESATGTIVCRCLRITEAQICEVADLGQVVNVREITRQTGAGAGCTACHKRIRELLAARSRENAAAAPTQLAIVEAA